MLKNKLSLVHSGSVNTALTGEFLGGPYQILFTLIFTSYSLEIHCKLSLPLQVSLKLEIFWCLSSLSQTIIQDRLETWWTHMTYTDMCPPVYLSWCSHDGWRPKLQHKNWKLWPLNVCFWSRLHDKFLSHIRGITQLIFNRKEEAAGEKWIKKSINWDISHLDF